jgi:MFS family permease
MVGTERRKWLALALLSAVQFMVVLDIAIVNVALPSIKVDLGFSQENLQWVISAYALFFGGFLLLGGRAADLLGRRRLFLVGVVVFTLASLLAGLAWSEGSLIAARSLQGLGAAVISPAALSILTTTFSEGRERNIALGVWGAVGGFGAAIISPAALSILSTTFSEGRERNIALGVWGAIGGFGGPGGV